MATKLKHQQHEQSNVVGLPTKCTAEGCSKKGDRLNLCAEHYDWFKFGLITKEGKRPSDFDKKFQAYSSRKKQAA